MCTWRRRLAAAALLVAAVAVAAAPLAPDYAGIGRVAKTTEIAAWDTDVRPDFKGLPAGSGSVARGMQVWEAKCASCHGTFGESNQTFSPLVGGTTAADIASGRVASLTDPAYPGRTTLMKLSTLSTLWDTIYRSMPWTTPKSLHPDEVYAVTAYLLNLGGILADDAVLSQANIGQVQQRLPNRHGMSLDHGLWPAARAPGAQQGGIGNGGVPDVRATACMTACAAEPKIVSSMPDHARNAHGNLAAQNRGFGAQRGVQTASATVARAAASGSEAAAATTNTTSTTTAAVAATEQASAAALALANRQGCLACHGLDQKIVGPSFKDVARKYGGRSDAVDYLAAQLRAGSSGQWGSVPMPAQAVGEADARTLASWLASGAGR